MSESLDCMAESLKARIDAAPFVTLPRKRKARRWLLVAAAFLAGLAVGLGVA